jgi:Xaa-Pro aminopeptidase
MDEQWLIPKTEFKERMMKLQKQIMSLGYDALIIFSSYLEREGNVSYLTNHRSSFPNVMSHKGLGHSAYILTQEGDGILIAPFGYEEDKVLNVDSVKTDADLIKGIKSAIIEKNLKGQKIGIVGYDVIPAEYYNNLLKYLDIPKMDSLDYIIENMRSIKSVAELNVLRKAAKVSDAGLLAAMEYAKAGKKEYEIEIVARQASMEAGADFISRVRISTGKKLVSLRWPMTTNREIQDGDLVYIDFIGFYKGYGFDVQRVKVVGNVSEEQKSALNLAEEVQTWLINSLKPGKTLNFVKMSTRGFKISPFAHGIGLEICETPSCVLEGSTLTPQEHMVLCIEPTVGNNNIGEFGLEDMVEITGDHAKILNSYSRILW